MKALLPLPIRRLRAKAELKGLSLYAISEGADVPYAEASRVMNGRHAAAGHHEKIAAFLKKAPMPEEAASKA